MCIFQYEQEFKGQEEKRGPVNDEKGQKTLSERNCDGHTKSKPKCNHNIDAWDMRTKNQEHANWHIPSDKQINNETKKKDSK